MSIKIFKGSEMKLTVGGKEIVSGGTLRTGPYLSTSTQQITDLIKMGLLAISPHIKDATKEDVEGALEELIKEKMPVGMFTGVKAELVENIVHVEIQMHSHAEKFEVETNILLTDVVVPPPPDPLDKNFLKDLKDL